MKIPHISNAFEHIKEACDQKIETLYPIKIPEIVVARYHQELAYLKESEYLDEFEIFRLLSKEAKKKFSVPIFTWNRYRLLHHLFAW